MKIVDTNFASITGGRISLSLASKSDSKGKKWFFIVVNGKQVTPNAKTIKEAKNDIDIMWGGEDSPWDLQYE